MKIYLSNGMSYEKKVSFTQFENSDQYELESLLELLIDNNLNLLNKGYNSVIVKYFNIELKKNKLGLVIAKDILFNNSICEIKPENIKVLSEWIIKNRKF